MQIRVERALSDRIRQVKEQLGWYKFSRRAGEGEGEGGGEAEVSSLLVV